MLHANSIIGALYNISSKVWKHQWQQEPSLSTVYRRSNNNRDRKVFRSWQTISSDDASQTAADSVQYAFFQSL